MQVLTSKDGKHWQEVGQVGPMWWPQVFKCASGVYVIGNSDPTDARALVASNDLHVAKMLSADGSRCAINAPSTKNIKIAPKNIKSI